MSSFSLLHVHLADLECSQEGSEDVDLDGLLAAAPRLLDALPEVAEQLLPMFVCHRRERLPEEDDRRIDNGHAEWEWPRDLIALERCIHVG